MTFPTQGRTIYVSAGASEYRYIVLTETTGKDISADAAIIALAPLGVVPAAEDFVTPDLKSNPTSSSVQMGMLISASSGSPGNTYVLWGDIADSPEVVAIPSPETITLG